jgi:multidrug efflux pump subunit AcrB
MHGFWKFFIRKRQFTVLLIAALIVVGSMSLFTIPKESAPEVKIPVGIVSAILPGASAADVEKLVTNKLEDGLNNLNNLDTITSSSREGVSVVTVQFLAKADIDKSIQDLKSQVDKIKGDLPDEVETPTVTEVNFADQPILIISVAGQYSPYDLTRLGDELKDDLTSIKGVSRVEVSGVQDREVQVIVKKEKLEQYGLRLVDVVSAIQSSNSSLPVGNITVDGISYALTLRGDIEDGSEVSDIAILSLSGKPIYVRDIAEVVDGLEDASTYSRVSTGGKPSVPSLTLTVFKSSGGNVVTVADSVKSRLEELKKSMLDGAEVLVSYDGGELVRDDLRKLTEVGLETMILVMLCLFLTIGWRESLVAAASIPLSFLIAFVGLQMSGNTINFISLFSLILAIGILVDSGIVVTEAIHTRMATHPSSEDAAYASIDEYSWPLVAGTMTTIAVFVPLFFISGIVGKFIASIPYTLIFVLLASIFVALGNVPLIAILFTSKKMNKLEERQEQYTHRVQAWYRGKLSAFLDNRRQQNLFLVGLGILFVVSLALPITGVIKTVFFPQDDSDFVYIEIERPEGTVLGQTDLATRAVEERLYENTDIESFVTTIGQGSAFNQSAGSGPKLANITALLHEDRTRTSTEVVASLRKEFSSFTAAVVHVYEPSNGPPSGAPVQIQFIGDDLDALETVVSRAEDLLSTISGATEINTSTKNNGTQFVLTIDKAKATALGLNPAIVAQTLRTAVHGATATTIRKQENDIDVLVKLNLNAAYTDPSQTNQVSPEDLRQLTIQTLSGPALLGTFMTVSVERSNAVISHEDRKRIESVSAFNAPTVTAGEITAAFMAREAELRLPPGVTIKLGGEDEDINNSFKEMGIAFLVGMLLMFAILVLEFNSFRYTLYLLSIIPLSLIGVFVGLALFNKPLSFSSLLGVIALAGVIINHAIILMDAIGRIEQSHGHLSHKDVVVEAATSRLRPIILTTVTTVVGMIPLTQASALWGPLAYSIMFGLAFSVLLTLVFIPILYQRWPSKSKPAVSAPLS